MRLRDGDPTGYDEVTARLRSSYDAGAELRDGMDKQYWKLAEREAFLDRLRAIGARTLLEIGAGTGEDGLFFRDEGGLRVVVVDLAPAMVERCRAKGLEAYVRDFLNLGFPASAFDAVYAMNSLLHVPNADLGAALRAVRDVLEPGGLGYLGMYGGQAAQGVAEDDVQEPTRFFAFRTDEQILRAAAAAFEIVDFHTVTDGEIRFQALTVARAAETA
ncbi:methyltransferase family protein [Krasilnikovia cinnamomea]|uniref:Methyltransferase family protein n=1 Tax=Krasilnikovia cinnamomea TaxID=349313 RepID=A0A4Q7ZN58_9ACTN|nr:class I SAM-dependent methyltransferase [Krasilnikovia cinnamomea]RZU51893.1 methyltransferase family protein [Krasilnikovia cinnamomea]